MDFERRLNEALLSGSPRQIRAAYHEVPGRRNLVFLREYSDGAFLVQFKCGAGCPTNFDRPIRPGENVLVKDGMAFTGPEALINYYLRSMVPDICQAGTVEGDEEIIRLALQELKSERAR